MPESSARLARLLEAAAAGTATEAALAELADLALATGRWADAATALERALSVAGTLPEPLAVRLVAAWAPLGKHEVAVNYLQRLASVGPELARAYQDLLESAVRAGKGPVARSGYAALSKGGDTATNLRLAELELEGGMIDAAAERLARIAQAQPGHVLARLLIRRAAGLRAARAIAELELLIARAPFAGGTIAFAHEGAVFHGPPSAAFVDALGSRDDLVENELFVALGRYQLERGETDTALRTLQRAKGAEPFLLPELAALKARIWARKGHADLALEELTSVSAAELVRAEQRDGLLLLMDLLEGQQRAVEALAVARAAARLGGEEIGARLRRLELTAHTQVEPVDGEGEGAPASAPRDAAEVAGIPVGTLIHGVYEVLGELGRGGMGIVLRVKNRKLDRVEALKLLPESSADAGAYERLVREAKLLAGLSHPAIVRVYALGRHEGRPFLAMELLDGETLGARLKNAGRMPISEVLWIARAVAVGLQAAHASGIVHRDVKPDNVMLLKGSRAAKLMDFGLAQTVHLDDGGSSSGVKRESFMGTIHYISPEQINGQDVGPRADVYSFGVVLYEMLTGQAPFDSPNPHNLMFMHLTRAAPSPRLLRPETPEALERLVLACLEKSPAKRPTDFGAVLAVLPDVRDFRTEGA